MTDEQLKRLDWYAFRARLGAYAARAAGYTHLCVWLDETYLVFDPPEIAENCIATVEIPASGSSDDWAVSCLWAALDAGLMPDFTEADFESCYLTRQETL